MSRQRSDTEALPMRHPERWLAVLRLTVGLWFLKSLFTKVSVAFVGGVIPLPVASERWIATMPKLITKYAAENPFPAYKAFLLGTVVPSHTYAHLTALGESCLLYTSDAADERSSVD